MTFYFVFQLLEPILLLGKDRFAGVDIRIRVRGGGHVAQVYGMLSLPLLIALFPALPPYFTFRPLTGVDIRIRVRGGGHVAQVYGKLDFLQGCQFATFLKKVLEILKFHVNP